MSVQCGECRRHAFGPMRRPNFDDFRRGNSWSFRGRGGFNGRGRFEGFGNFSGPFGHQHRGSFGAGRDDFEMHGSGPFGHHRRGSFGDCRRGSFGDFRRGSFPVRGRPARHFCLNHCSEHREQIEHQHQCPFQQDLCHERHCQCHEMRERQGCVNCQHVCGNVQEPADQQDQPKNGDCQLEEVQLHD